MEIIFMGTGGGRINLLKQIRATGGFRINSKSANIHVDPGPGALLHSLRLKQDPLRLDVLIVTHNHIDHVNDANLFTEALSQYTLKKQGIVIGAEEVINGDEHGDRGISLYHQSKVVEVYIAKWGDKKTFKTLDARVDTKKGEFKIEIIKTKHDEPTAFGFKLFLDGKVMGYTTDTEPFDGIGKDYVGCDILIINCLKPEKDKYSGHLATNDCIDLLKIAKPKLAVLSHLGMKMIPVADSEAKKIETATGVRCIAAKDGQKLEV